MCTNFRCRTATDGSVVVGRSMEFPPGIPWCLGVVPVGHAGVASGAPAGKGLTWTATYGVVGISAFGKPTLITDGMNTQGLSGHGLYMPGGFCEYSTVTDGARSLSEVDVLTYLLGTCGSLSEVRQAMSGVEVFGFDPGMGLVPPLHFLMHDRSGSLAIEFHAGGEISIVDNPLGVGTNAPYLDWHLTNLRNYVGISGVNPKPMALTTTTGATSTLAPLGQGQGLRELPASYSPPDRFVRAVAFTQLAPAAVDGWAAELQAAHILNAFDIVPGTIREYVGSTETHEETDWATICNLSQLRFAYRMFEDQTWYVVDLASTDFTSARTMELPATTRFVRVTP